MELNTITVSDGISMGTEGMKYSLVSREVIADSIETVVGCLGYDGLVAIGGCDKNMPGAMIAIARMNILAGDKAFYIQPDFRINQLLMLLLCFHLLILLYTSYHGAG